jgi:hydrogenase expression/formation protein HypE
MKPTESENADSLITGLACPIPIVDYPQVVLAHGGGGRLTRQLIESMFQPAFANAALDAQHDSAVLEVGSSRLAFTTDSHVISPLDFPGGDIGRLAVFGTVNDLAVSGAKPLYLSAGLILEEGFPMDHLWRIVCSMRDAAREANVQIVTGDTKVVDKGKGDGIYINTSGVGVIEASTESGPGKIEAGDAVLISGDVGRHGVAVMAVREGLEFETEITSDCGSLAAMVTELLTSGVPVHCMRDLTRGGMATAVIELAEQSASRIELEGDWIPLKPGVRGACEILGLDPLYVACEGRMVLFVPENAADQALSVLRRHPIGEGAVVIGRVTENGRGKVTVRTEIGTHRLLTLLSGEQLPRIC